MALVTVRRSSSVRSPKKSDESEKISEAEDDASSKISKSLNECYFANKGAALALGGKGGNSSDRHRSPVRSIQPDIQHHLQAMFCLLRPEETLKMAVKLESVHPCRTRYLVVVCRGDEAALLGIDCNEVTSVGLVLRVLADTSIKLDGDGGFSVCVCTQQHIFKPVSVQAMWSALQTLHRASGKARELNHFAGGPSHLWTCYYEERITSDRSCLNEWHAMDSIESRRPPSPDSLRLKPRQRDETEKVIRCTLKEIMMSVDLDEVTSKVIRGRLEEDLDMDLAEYKSFIDQEMLTILGQMDSPTEIFEHVYLGSEWNASNLEELQRNGVRHILNVTREIDNFFPGMFDYLNVRVYDDEKTDLLKHWDNTFKYINKARNDGSKVLVHCKMGISRSASVVIAYAMKAYNWNFDKALKHVKTKRTCIKPNMNFLSQLETYQGILDAMKNKEKLQRSKSETNLKIPKGLSKAESKTESRAPLSSTVPDSPPGRPRSWSPDSHLASQLLPPTSVSMENLASETRHMLMPCANGSYSVSPNQIIRLKGEGAPSVKLIVHEIESASVTDKRDFVRKHQRLLFGSNNVHDEHLVEPLIAQDEVALKITLDSVPPSRGLATTTTMSDCEAERIHTWDPGENGPKKNEDVHSISFNDNIVNSDSGIIDTKVRTSETFSNVIERDDKKHEEEASPLSRRSSWSSLDSAVVPDLSRHSSWGSADKRPDEGRQDLDIITEHLESGKSRKPLSENERKFNETCAILKQLAEAKVRAKETLTWCGRLSASVPADTWVRSGPRRRRLSASSHGDIARSTGHVHSLKKEFEARERDADDDSKRTMVRADTRERTQPVRALVDKYDNNPSKSTVSDHAKSVPSHETGSKKYRMTWEGESSRFRSVPPFIRNPFNGERPPVAPNVVAPNMTGCNFTDKVISTVMSKAQNKKQLQHGKTHPLTRLNLNRSNNRCSNPVYNTM